jgi:hypothetical protein
MNGNGPGITPMYRSERVAPPAHPKKSNCESALACICRCGWAAARRQVASHPMRAPGMPIGDPFKTLRFDDRSVEVIQHVIDPGGMSQNENATVLA